MWKSLLQTLDHTWFWALVEEFKLKLSNMVIGHLFCLCGLGTFYSWFERLNLYTSNMSLKPFQFLWIIILHYLQRAGHISKKIYILCLLSILKFWWFEHEKGFHLSKKYSGTSSSDKNLSHSCSTSSLALVRTSNTNTNTNTNTNINTKTDNN